MKTAKKETTSESLSRDDLKSVMKEALTEFFDENPNLIKDAIYGVIEDIGLGKVMEEGENSGYVDTDQFMKELQDKID